ncbi:hypothetical protein BC332_13008 [Capsicum chinense]|nr:hypothetical protein BC332_13008 [Capsicum chinense]
MHRSGNVTCEKQYLNMQRWLLFLIHARRCSAPEGKCPESNSIHAQKLLRHMERYSKFDCRYLQSPETNVLINDYRQCKNVNCPVWIPVKKFMQTQQKVFARPGYISDITNSLSGTCRNFHAVETASKLTGNLTPVAVKTSENLQPSVTEVKMEALTNAVQVTPGNTDIAKDNLDDTYAQRSAGDSLASSIPGCLVKQENVNTGKDINQPKQVNTSAPSENATQSKSRKPKIKGVSMMELFNPEQSKEKAEKNKPTEHSMSEKSCQLCAAEKPRLKPPAIYCTPCGARIKSNRTYYTIGAGDTRQYCCFRCYYKASGDTIIVEGTTIPKARMDEKRNGEETEEWWVQCDKCKAWQHQICALFNGRRNDCGRAEYTCPYCYIAEVERGECKPLPQSAVLGAKDLPQTILSDHVEKRFANSLKEERVKRAKREGKVYDESFRLIGAFEGQCLSRPKSGPWSRWASRIMKARETP